MSRRERIIWNAVCFGLMASLLGAIIAAPVMREAPAAPTVEMVCHVDREMLDGEWADVSKCHEEAL